jgi:hypothetical protein
MQGRQRGCNFPMEMLEKGPTLNTLVKYKSGIIKLDEC